MIKKYIKTPVVDYNNMNNICMKKYEYDHGLGLENPDIISSSRTTSREEDTHTSLQSITFEETINMMPNTTESTAEPDDDDEDTEFENRCLICGIQETTCNCYEASMDEINAEEEAVYVSSLGPYQKTDYEKHKKMEEFLRIYCGK
jgi:hypothetical protein